MAFFCVPGVILDGLRPVVGTLFDDLLDESREIKKSCHDHMTLCLFHNLGFWSLAGAARYLNI